MNFTQCLTVFGVLRLYRVLGYKLIRVGRPTSASQDSAAPVS